MNPVKFIWCFRAFANKIRFHHIGKMTYMGKPCFIEGASNISIGNYVRIFPGIRMEAIKKGRIEIKDNVAIEQNVHITSEGSTLSIGKDTTILANTFLTNIDHKYDDIHISVLEQKHELYETKIGESCFIGAGSAIQAGTILGNHCVVGANSVVRGQYPDYCVLVGAPARIIKRYNLETQVWEKEERKK